MELRTTREMRRNEQLSKALSKKADSADAAPKAQAQPAQKQPSADKLTLSRQALSWIDERNRQMWEWDQERQERRNGRIDGMIGAMETEKKQLDNMSKSLDMMNKCQKIAAALMKGNRVPPEDLIYLMQHDQEGYKMALALRRENPDPKDEKSVLDDEDKNGSAEAVSGGEEAPSVSPPMASSGGGEASAPAE